MSICNRVVNITSAGAAIISDNPTETATGTLKVHRCSSAGNTFLTISHANSTKYSYVQLQNDDNSHQYHLGIGNTAVPNAAVRGKFYLFANASSKSLLEIDSSGRAKFQTSVGSGGANASATWHTETSGLQLVGPCACTLSRFMITAVDPASSPNACAVYSQLTMGHWDNSRVLLESTGKQLMITSYDEGIALGNDGSAELCIGTSGDVIIKPTTAKNVDPLGTLCLDITGSTNPQNGGIVMNSTSQTHIRFLSSGNLCWQWRHHNPTTEDKFSAYSWTRACDMFNIQGSNAYFGGYGHITSCAPIYIANTLDPYFINASGNKCMYFYYYQWTGGSCFGQTHLMARFDHSQTNVCQVYPTATLYNASETEGTSSTLAFAGKEASGGNSVGLAYISGRKEGSVSGNWGKGSLNFLVNCDGTQCWTTCMTMCGGVCVIKCLVAPIIQLANSNCVLCLATGGSAGPYFQGSADCTISYWGIDSSWKAQINSDGGFCAANCVVAPFICADCIKTTTCLCTSGALITCQTGAGCNIVACLTRANGVDNHHLSIAVNPDNNCVIYTSSGAQAGLHCFANSVYAPYVSAADGFVLCTKKMHLTDCRCICPASFSTGHLHFGFGSYDNNGVADYADFLLLSSYTDQTGGCQNLLTFRRTGGIGMRIYQSPAWANSSTPSSSPFSTFVEVVHSGNISSYVTETTINNNADNRVITGSGSADTLNGESNLTFNGSTLNVTGSIVASGDITSTSDCRVKCSICEISNAIQIVSNLCGVSFIKNNKRQIGFIAQEVEKILPEIVFNNEDDEENGLKSISYGNITALLLEAIKEQNIRIDNQQEEIDCLKEIIKSK